MTGVKADAAQHLFNTLVEHAGTCDLIEHLTVAALLSHPGRTPKVVNCTQESRALQQLAHANPKHKFDNLGIPLVRSTIDCVMFTHNKIPISQKVKQYKPTLNVHLIE